MHSASPFTSCWPCWCFPSGSVSATSHIKGTTRPSERPNNDCRGAPSMNERRQTNRVQDDGRGTSEVVVVTGASAGVGRAIAREFARHGAAIGLLARGNDGLAGATDDVERLGGRALAIRTDTADDRQVEEAAERVERELG